MIKLQDFAKQCGVTDRQIQRHLVAHAAELEGLYQRRGPNGTWLTEEACEILRSKMRQNPIILGDRQTAQEKEDLQKQVLELQGKLIAAHELIQEQRAQLDAGSTAVLRLQAAESQAQAATEALGAAQRENGSLQAQLEMKSQEATEADRKAQEAARAAQEAVEAERKAAEEARRDAEQSAHEAAAAQEEAAKLRRELEDLKAASIWRRIFSWR